MADNYFWAAGLKKVTIAEQLPIRRARRQLLSWQYKQGRTEPIFFHSQAHPAIQSNYFAMAGISLLIEHTHKIFFLPQNISPISFNFRRP